MPHAGETIENPVTGQTMIFRMTERETRGEMFQMEGIFRPGGFAGAPHIHPMQEERFDVMAGTAGFQIGRKVVRLGVGESITVPAGQAHTFWNEGEGELRVMMDFRPALASTGRFYEWYFGLARDGRAGKNGLPSIWQVALQAGEFADHVRLARPPWAIQRVVFALLRPVARRLGYRRLGYAESGAGRDGVPKSLGSSGGRSCM